MNQGDIVVINFPFTSLDASKVRPALVISNEAFNRGRNVLLVAISTQKGPPIYSHSLEGGDLELGKLKKMSFIRFHNILSVDKKLVLKRVARLSEVKLGKVVEKLKGFIDL